jgi:hypothetical protein
MSKRSYGAWSYASVPRFHFVDNESLQNVKSVHTPVERFAPVKVAWAFEAEPAKAYRAVAFLNPPRISVDASAMLQTRNASLPTDDGCPAADLSFVPSNMN